MVRISVPLPEATWKGLRRVAEQRRVSGCASLSTLIGEILTQAVSVANVAPSDITAFYSGPRWTRVYCSQAYAI